MENNSDIQVAVGGLISSRSSEYEVLGLLGSGSFGDVAKCRKKATNEIVAVKVIRNPKDMRMAQKEEAVLKILKELGSDRHNIIRWIESFSFRGRFCLEFENLDISLSQFLRKRRKQALTLMEVRPVIQQVASALDFLKMAGIVHADLKPQNIMMVDHIRQPLKVKVIDFGLAMIDPAAHTGVTVQAFWYRAPEIMLGTPFNEAIDVWSLGVTAAEMLTGMALFPGVSEFDTFRLICCTVGRPPDHMLERALYIGKFFDVRSTSKGFLMWKLQSKVKTGTPDQKQLPSLESLSDLKNFVVSPELCGEDRRADTCDRAVFVDLLTKIQRVDPACRISPSEILQHQFISMNHLHGVFNGSSHVKKGKQLMKVCEHVRPHKEQTSTCTTDPSSNRGSVTKERKRSDGQSTAFEFNPLGKKRRSVNPNEQLKDSVNKLLSSTEVTCPSLTPVRSQRKRL